MRKKTCTKCGRRWTEAEWRQLPLVGHQCVPEDEHGPEEHREYRNCVCCSTLLVQVGRGHVGTCELPRVRDRTRQRDPDTLREWALVIADAVLANDALDWSKFSDAQWRAVLEVRDDLLRQRDVSAAETITAAWARGVADAIVEHGRTVDWKDFRESDRRALLAVRNAQLRAGDLDAAEAMTKSAATVYAGTEWTLRGIERERWKRRGIYPTLWKSTTYASPSSKHVTGTLIVEGRTRAEALSLLERLAESENASAARSHARAAIGGDVRHTLTRITAELPYAAADGRWRGWSADDWREMPPRAYGRW